MRSDTSASRSMPVSNRWPPSFRPRSARSTRLGGSAGRPRRRQQPDRGATLGEVEQEGVDEAG
ncbi:MAG: hypothetical protein AVDCRST_MAG88-1196, partial [uncultured Thermomicrobiales bacterium]